MFPASNTQTLLINPVVVLQYTRENAIELALENKLLKIIPAKCPPSQAHSLHFASILLLVKLHNVSEYFLLLNSMKRSILEGFVFCSEHWEVNNETHSPGIIV
jgi:hypothetical protein